MSKASFFVRHLRPVAATQRAGRGGRGCGRAWRPASPSVLRGQAGRPDLPPVPVPRSEPGRPCVEAVANSVSDITEPKCAEPERREMESRFRKIQKSEAMGDPGRRTCPRLQQHPGHHHRLCGAAPSTGAGRPGRVRQPGAEPPCRGARPEPDVPSLLDPDLSSREARRTWSHLIHKIYESTPWHVPDVAAA